MTTHAVQPATSGAQRTVARLHAVRPGSSAAAPLAARVLGNRGYGRIAQTRAPLVQRACETCHDEDDVVRAKHDTTAGSPPAPESPPDAGTITAGGAPLAATTRAFYERAFERDFSAVRVHTGPAAARHCAALDARAFTYAHHIWLGHRAEAERSFVLAHELAHVVQQTQPRARTGSTPDGTAHAPAAIQRLGLSEPFWVPLRDTGVGIMTGTEIHDLITTNAKQTKGLAVEAPVPNADAGNVGLDRWGRADFYKATPQVYPGVNFVKDPMTDPDGRPKRHKALTRAQAENPGYTAMPTVTKAGVINGVKQGPTSPHFGELKPASLEMVRLGKEQLANYRQGYLEAARQTNRWSAARGSADRWSVGTPGVLGPKEITLDARFTFNRTAPLEDRRLALAQVVENVDAKKPERLKARFIPPFRDRPIMGGLYAAPTDSGIWMYFARPKSIEHAVDALKDLPFDYVRKKDKLRADMAWATEVHQHIVGALLKAPEKKIATLRAAGSGASPEHRGHAPPANRDGVTMRAPASIQRRKRTPAQLEDKFELKSWRASHKRVGKAIRGGDTSTAEAAQLLEFLDLAYRADRGLAAVSATGTSTLPAKSSLTRTIKGDDGQKSQKRAVPDFFRWIHRWTSPATGVLGTFRDRFGGAFVNVANKLSRLTTKVRDKVTAAFNKGKAKVKLKTGMTEIALKALGRALIAIGRVFIPHTISLVVGAIRTGIEKQLAKLFGKVETQLLELKDDEDSTIGAALKEFDGWKERATELHDQAETFVTDIETEYGKKLEPIKNVVDLAGTIGPILEVGMVLLQCATPLGWGCLKLFARAAALKLVDEVLGVCYVQKEVACAVAKIRVVQDLPKELAQVIMTQLRGYVGKLDVPPEIKAVFDENIAQEPLPDCNEITCTSGSATGGEPDGEGAAGATGQAPDAESEAAAHAMGKLMRETGAQKIDALADFARAAGVPDTAPFRPAHAERLRSLLAGLSVQELRAGAKGKANDATRKKLEPLAEMLNGVARQEILRQAVAQFKAGAFDADLKALKDSGGERWWKLVGSYPFGLSRNRTLLVHANGRDAVGVADVVISECLPNGRVPYEFTRVALRDRNGDAVTDMKIPTKGDAHVLTGCAGSAVAGTAKAAEDTGSTGKGQRQEDADENATGGVVAGVQPAPAPKPAGKRRSASAAPPAPGGRKGGGKKSQAAGTGGPARAVPTHIIADNASKPAPPANAQEQFPATALVRDEPVSAPYRKGQSLSLYVWMWSPGDIWVGVPRVPAVIHSIRYQAGPIPPHGLYRLSRVSVTLPSDVYFRVPKLSARTHVIRSAQIIHALSIRTKAPKTPSVEEKNMIHAFET